MIAGTAAGPPTIHVLNTTASAIESLTLSWWCSSIGDLRETACNRGGAYSHVDGCEQLANRAESSSLLSLLDVAVVSASICDVGSVIAARMRGQRRFKRCVAVAPLVGVQHRFSIDSATNRNFLSLAKG